MPESMASTLGSQFPWVTVGYSFSSFSFLLYEDPVGNMQVWFVKSCQSGHARASISIRQLRGVQGRTRALNFFAFVEAPTCLTRSL